MSHALTVDARRAPRLLDDIATALKQSADARRQAQQPRPKPIAFAASAGFARLDPWQAAVLTSPARQLLLNCSRQAGKSSISGLLACYEACYVPGSIIVLLSPSERQSLELFKKVTTAYRASGQPTATLREHVMGLELVNGSRILALPGNELTVRGISGVTLLLVDEAARVPDDLYRAVRPMLAVSGGRLVAMSTPFGKRGWWFEAWTGSEDWQRIEVPATLCPRISPEFLAEERAALGPVWFSQEYGCQFADQTSAVFAYDAVMAAVDADVAPLFGSEARCA